MPVVLAQHGLIDEGDNAVRLAKYAQLTQDECEFWGVTDPANPIDDSCNPILTLPEREQIARYLGEAQEEIEQVIGYPLSQRWFTDELPYAPIIHAKRKKILDIGTRATEDVALGAAISHVTDPATVGPIATTVTDADEIRVYHPGTDIEIDPSDITITGGNVTISIPRCRLVEAASVDNPQTGLDYTDVPPSATSPFEATLDVKRVYNDSVTTQATLVWPHRSSASDCSCSCGCWVCGEYTHEACAYIRDSETGAIDVLYAHLVGSVWTATCPCVCSNPEIVRVYYKAGVTTLTKQAEDAIIHLAHAKMPRPNCGCGVLRDKWDSDRIIPENMTLEQAQNPFGPWRGSWIAWRFANAMKSYRLGVL
jgi:hypothetical protein